MKPERWDYDERRRIICREFTDTHDVLRGTLIPLDERLAKMLAAILDAIDRNTYSEIGGHIRQGVLAAFADYCRPSDA